jgi:autotransporter-associated beta strand protein
MQKSAASSFRLAVILLFSCVALSAHAASYTNNSVSPWTNSSAWTSGSFSTNDPNGIIVLSTPATTTRTNDYSIVVLNKLFLTQSTVTLQGGGLLRFTNSGALVQMSGSGGNNINEAVEVTGPTIFRITGSSPINVNSNITGLGSLIISNSGLGQVKLFGSNTFAGGVTISNGTLSLGHAWALGTGSLTIATSGAILDATTALTLATTNQQAWNSDFTFTGTGNLTMGPGTVTLGTNVTVTTSAKTLTVPGSITGAYGLVKAGSGILTLSGGNTFAGGVSNAAGLLVIANANALGAGLLTFSGGALSNAGNNAVVNDVNLGSSAAISVASGETLTIGGVITNTGGLVKLASGTLILSGNNTYTGGTLLSNGTLSISSDANLGGASGGLTFNGGTLQVTVATLTNLNTRTVNWNTFNGGFDITNAGNTFTVTNSLTNARLVKGGAGTLVLNNAAITNLGFSAGGGTLQVLSGASTFAGALAISNGSTLLLSGTNGQPAGTQPSFTLGGALTVGNADSGNTLILRNGASVAGATTFTLGSAAASRGNLVVLSDSTLTNSVTVGSSGSDNSLVVSNRGSVVGATLSIGATASSSNNLVLISGSGSSVVSTNNSTGVYVGSIGSQNALVVTNGGLFSSVGSLYVANGAGSSNFLLVSGAGSVVSNNSTHFHVGMVGASNNAVLVNDGGLLVSGGLRLGSGLGSFNNSLVVTGAGSTFRTAVSGNQIVLGSNSTTLGTASLLLVQDQGTLEFGSGAGNVVLIGGFNNTAALTNQGGILQFTTSTYTITPNTKDSFVMTNGTLSYRGVAAADITSGRFLTNFLMQGDNSFRLLDSTNATGLAAYTFDSVANTGLSTNFQRLVLMGAASQWRSERLNVGTGGELLVTNTVSATVGAMLTSSGSVRVINSTVTWQSNVVLSGSYFSDPSTNTFASNVTVTASGSLSGSNGDLFVFGGNFLNQSTNRSAFNLWQTAVLFTNLAAGTTNHTYDVSGSASVSYGTGFTNFDRVSTNFAIGTLSIAPGNRLTLTGSVSAVDGRTNAVYVGWLDIQGIFTNSFDNVTNGLFAALNLPNINLYYDRMDPRNDWLNANLTGIAAGGYNLWGGGLLLPIPEPSPLLATGAGLALLAFLRRGCGGQAFLRRRKDAS